MDPVGPVALRPAAPDDPADGTFLRALFAAAKPDAERAVAASVPGYAVVLAMQYEACRRAYAARYPGADDRLVTGADGSPIGRLLTHRSAEALRVVDIALLPRARGRGIGGALLRRLKAEAAGAGVPLRLSVAVGNPARRLYEREGFRTVAATQTDTEMEWTPPDTSGAASP